MINKDIDRRGRSSFEDLIKVITEILDANACAMEIIVLQKREGQREGMGNSNASVSQEYQ